MPKSNHAGVSNAGELEADMVVRATGEVQPVNPGELDEDTDEARAEKVKERSNKAPVFAGPVSGAVAGTDKTEHNTAPDESTDDVDKSEKPAKRTGRSAR